MLTRTADLGFILIGGLLAAFYTALSVSILFGDDNPTLGDAVFAAVSFGASGMILAGVRLISRSPVLGSVLLVAGAIPIGVIVWWMIIPLVVGLLVSAFGVWRAVTAARERNRRFAGGRAAIS